MAVLKREEIKEFPQKKKRSNTLHSELVEIGYRWLMYKARCSFALKEIVNMSDETPDVIGFRGNHSILIEVKTSRADFLADKKKRFRISPEKGMGNYRLFLCPEGLIKPDELPEGWGLLYCKGKRVKCIVPEEVEYLGKMSRFNKDLMKEQTLLCSVVRRMHAKKLLQNIYN